MIREVTFQRPSIHTRRLHETDTGGSFRRRKGHKVGRRAKRNRFQIAAARMSAVDTMRRHVELDLGH